MSKDKLTDYDATAANNTDVGGISIAEGMLPSAVNNAIREQMSHQKEAFGAGTPLYVDQTNNKVGIGTASPAVDLEVEATTTNGLARIGQLQFKNSSGNFTASSDGVHIFPFSDGNVYHDNYDGGFAFRPSGTERARITANGITFNGDTAAANALNDYEIGTFTFNVSYNPDATGVSNSGSTKVDAATAHYTKIGNLCTVYYPSITLTTLGLGTTACLVGGYELPFAAASGANSNTQVSGYNTSAVYNNTHFAAQLSGFVSDGYTYMLFNAYATAAAAGSGFVKLINGGNIIFTSITYKVS